MCVYIYIYGFKVLDFFHIKCEYIEIQKYLPFGMLLV